MSYDNILKMYFPYKHIFLITLIEWLMLKKAWTKGGHAHTLELGCKYQHIIFLFFLRQCKGGPPAFSSGTSLSVLKGPRIITDVRICPCNHHHRRTLCLSQSPRVVYNTTYHTPQKV